MKLINNYINEKLKISSKTPIESVVQRIDKKVAFLSDLYNVNDVCIIASSHGISRGSEYINILPVKIIRKLKTKIVYIELFNLNNDSPNKTPKDFKFDKSNNEVNSFNTNAYLISGQWVTSMIIPQDECADFLDIIKRNNYEIDFWEILYQKEGINAEFKSKIPVTKLTEEAKNSGNPINRYSQEKITDDDINEIRKYIVV